MRSYNSVADIAVRDTMIRTESQMPAKTSGATKKTALHLERYVPGLLAWLSNKLARSASHIYRKQYGLGIVEWRILSYLAVFDIGTGADISQFIGIDKAALSRAAVFLDEKKYITVKPGTGRRIEFKLTAKGRAMHDRIIHLALAREKALLTGLNKQEIDNLIGYLHVLLKNLPAVEQVDFTEF